MLDVLQLKHTVNRMPLEKVRTIVEELQLEGIVTKGKTPFSRVHFNTCFAEIEALLQRAGVPQAAGCGRLSRPGLCHVRPHTLGSRRSTALAQRVCRGSPRQIAVKLMSKIRRWRYPNAA
jgi:hypothetical protein